MKEPIHILYISGMGDKYDSLRLRVLKKWRFKNVSVELVPMKWATGMFERKIAKIEQAIDRASGKRIVIIGESAGGSMAVHMYARRPDDLFKVMGLCGKSSHPETVDQHYYDHSPAFRTSMDLLNDSIAKLTVHQKRNFISVYPIYDPTVPVKETLLEGCKKVRLPAVGHFITITLALTIFSPLIIRAIRR
ncbi:MAG: hypothetical protein WAW80_02905 [Candidatus Saccharimonadales bacterium]